MTRAPAGQRAGRCHWPRARLAGAGRAGRVRPDPRIRGARPGSAGRWRSGRAAGRPSRPSSPPMREDTLFRIASVTKPIGGALTLSLVQDGVLAPRRPDRALAAGGSRARASFAARRPARPTRPRRAGRSPSAHLLTLTCGWGAVLEETPAAGGDDRAGRVPRAADPADVRRRVRRAGRRAAARLPAGRGLALRHRRSTCSACCWRAPPGSRCPSSSPSASPGRWAWPTRPSGRRTSSGWPRPTSRAGDGLEVLDPPDGVFAGPPRFEELSWRPGVHRRRRPALLSRHGRRRRAGADAPTRSR